MEEQKKAILNLFNEKVRGKKPDISNANIRHHGASGHWLERQFGIDANGRNDADLFGYEMKNNTSAKTTFGDWSANYRIFKNNPDFNRNQFLKTFGKPNQLKNNRYSWSGEPCPNIKGFNKFGQKLEIDDTNNIIAIYNYSKDLRPEKAIIVPENFQIEGLILAKWESASIKGKLERKFNQNGWFKCLLDESGVYCSIVFGAPMNYDGWIKLVKLGIVFFDSGMYQGNNRPYSMWRANNNFWESLIIEKY